ncbi:MAG TPA: beta-L-arabinofuranosidase domain-containing protein [Thermomicrobiales bacterium]|nr:beta-L-arabinofuranosidase domain-containing protein [Thermomicrobiales bacterium]
MATEVRTKAVIVDTTASPNARLRPVAVGDVRLSDPIWEPRRRLTTERTIPEQHALLESSQRLDNFRRAAGTMSGPFHGRYFNDTDVYKWLEAASWALAMEPDPALDTLVDEVIEIVGAAQLPDGYLDNFYTVDQLDKRWTNLTVTHELYCAGHLFQAGVAHHRATGKTSLLDICCKFADLICDTFGPESEGKTPGTDGHEEVELALVELGRATGNRRYIQQALYFLDARGYGLVGGDEYHQDHVPFRDASEVVGHAVRQVYLTAGAADVYAEVGDESIKAALDRLWESMTQRRIYISSGIGSRWDGEAFGRDLELGNERAYTESCAAIGSVMWNWRMLLITGDAKYADLIESTLLNAMLPGVSLSGDLYFYQNPLADDGHHRRQPWFDCACCPPNIARTLAQLSGYFATTSPEGIWLHLYAQSDLDLSLEDGRSVKIAQRTDYPWSGRVTLNVDGSGDFSLFLRIPGWVEGATVRFAGTPVVGVEAGQYLEIHRDWNPGDTVELDFPMPVRTMVSHPNLFENQGRVAVMRGPLLYCLERAGNDELDPRDAKLAAAPAFSTEHKSDLLGGVTILRTKVVVESPGPEWDHALYLPTGETSDRVAGGTRTAELIPYFAWANREAGPMQVWLRTE